MKRSFEYTPRFLNRDEGRNKLHEEIISEHWDVRGAITFKKPTSLEEAEKKLKKILKYYIDTRDEKLTKGCVNVYAVYETNESRLGVHIHVLLRGVYPNKAMTLQERFCKYIGNSLVAPYDSTRNVSWYMANKYGSRRYIKHDRYTVNTFRW